MNDYIIIYLFNMFLYLHFSYLNQQQHMQSQLRSTNYWDLDTYLHHFVNLLDTYGRYHMSCNGRYQIQHLHLQLRRWPVNKTIFFLFRRLTLHCII